MSVPTWKVDDEDLAYFVELVNEAFDADFDPEDENEFVDRVEFLQNNRLPDVMHDLAAARQFIASLGEVANG